MCKRFFFLLPFLVGCVSIPETLSQDESLQEKKVWVDDFGMVWEDRQGIMSPRTLRKAYLLHKPRILNKVNILNKSKILNQSKILNDSKVLNDAKILNKAETLNKPAILNEERLEADRMRFQPITLHNPYILNNAQIINNARILNIAYIINKPYIMHPTGGGGAPPLRPNNQYFRDPSYQIYGDSWMKGARAFDEDIITRPRNVIHMPPPGAGFNLRDTLMPRISMGPAVSQTPIPTLIPLSTPTAAPRPKPTMTPTLPPIENRSFFRGVPRRSDTQADEDISTNVNPSSHLSPITVDLREIVNQDENSPLTLSPAQLMLEKGKKLFAGRQYFKARKELKSLLTFAPDDLEAQTAYGLSLLATGRYEQAVDRLDSAMKHAKKDERSLPSLLEFYQSYYDMKNHLRKLKQYVQDEAPIPKAVKVLLTLEKQAEEVK